MRERITGTSEIDDEREKKSREYEKNVTRSDEREKESIRRENRPERKERVCKLEKRMRKKGRK